MTATDHVRKEQKRLETNVRRALLVVGFRRVIQLCADHAKACHTETTDTEIKARWLKVWTHLAKAVHDMQP